MIEDYTDFVQLLHIKKYSHEEYNEVPNYSLDTFNYQLKDQSKIWTMLNDIDKV